MNKLEAAFDRLASAALKHPEGAAALVCVLALTAAGQGLYILFLKATC